MGLIETYDYYWNQKADPRTDALPLVASPITIPFILFLYFYFVLKWGPRFMENRKPYDLKTYNQFFNAFQIITNAYIVYNFIDAGWFTTISIYCELPDYSYEPGPYKIAITMWITTMLKLIDLTETVVYILRKKYNQVSFLHVYHHVTTLLISWMCTKFVPVQMASFIALVNCAVHVIMYTYYLLSTFGPEMRQAINKYKHILTITQMVQFVVLLMYCIESLLPSCEVTRVPGIVLGLDLIVNFVLFYNFYQQQYKKNNAKTK